MKNEVWVVFKIMYAEKNTKHHPNSNNSPPINILHTEQQIKYDFFFFSCKWQSNNKFILESCFLLNVMFIVRDISKHMDNTEVGAQM